MALSIPDVISKLLDNANLGKLVTDVGSGFALTVPILMAFGLWTHVSILPADRAKELRSAIGDVGIRIDTEKKELAAIVQAWASLADSQISKAAVKPPGQERPPAVPKGATGSGDSAVPPPTPLLGPEGMAVKAMDEETRFVYSRRAIARVAATVESLTAQIKAEKEAAKIATLAAEREPYSSMGDQLAAQKEIVDQEVARKVSLENELKDAKSLEKNMEVFTNNISAVLAFSVIFGVVLSQVARFVIVRNFYTRLLHAKDFKVITQADAVRHQPDEESKDEVQALVPDYYRYVEGCVNLSIPVFLSGIAFPLFAANRLDDVAPYYWLFIPAGFILSGLLLLAGFNTYKDYRSELARLAPTAPAVPPPPQDR